jgi:hypothetical protein
MTRFNSHVWADLMFIHEWIFLIVVDDCTRYTTVHHTDYKNWDSLEKAFRRSWVQHFGPPLKITIDRERALAHEQFGVNCEAIGTVRELICAREDHTAMSVIDTRIGILRTHCSQNESTSMRKTWQQKCR